MTNLCLWIWTLPLLIGTDLDPRTIIVPTLVLVRTMLDFTVRTMYILLDIPYLAGLAQPAHILLLLYDDWTYFDPGPWPITLSVMKQGTQDLPSINRTKFPSSLSPQSAITSPPSLAPCLLKYIFCYYPFLILPCPVLETIALHRLIWALMATGSM